MSTNTLNPSIEQQLINNLKYSPTDINTIKTSSTLVSLLNSFNGKLTYQPSYSGAYHQGNEIVLGKAPYNNFSTLAHELGHATGDYQASHPNASQYIFFDKYSSAREYADERERGEGEAIYYEVKVGEELNPSGYNKNSLM